MWILRGILPIPGNSDPVPHHRFKPWVVGERLTILSSIAALNASTIRRFVLTLITGYLAIYGVRQIPYDFPNEWGVIIPVLIVVYVITVWLDGLIFSGATSVITSDHVKEQPSKRKPKKRASGFGD